MFGLFKDKPFLTEANFVFQVSTFKWLLKNFGGDEFYKETKLILPTKDFFPSEVASNEMAAEETFKAVKHHAGMDDWPCKLQAQEEDADPIVAPTLIVKNVPQNPLGTFEAKSKDEIVITYNPSVVENPIQLVATFAHELAHYLTGCSEEEPPGGWDNWEFATDIAAVFMGFGVFMANSAFNFQQFTSVGSQGWQSSRNGYLSEEEHIYALAIFLELKELHIESVTSFLKGNLRNMLNKAKEDIAKRKTIDLILGGSN